MTRTNRSKLLRKWTVSVYRFSRSRTTTTVERRLTHVFSPYRPSSPISIEPSIRTPTHTTNTHRTANCLVRSTHTANPLRHLDTVSLNNPVRSSLPAGLPNGTATPSGGTISSKPLVGHSGNSGMYLREAHLSSSRGMAIQCPLFRICKDTASIRESTTPAPAQVDRKRVREWEAW
jgi:hypothetical protein